MTTELVLLLSVFAFIVGGLFFGEKGPIKVFEKSGPRLAARIEQQITVGREFKVKGGSYNQWTKQPGAPPDGHL
jgi:hypothetical protein